VVVDGTKMTLTLSFFHIKQQSSHALNQSDLFFFVFFFFFLRGSCRTFLINMEMMGTKMALLLPSPGKINMKLYYKL
jgi:hypothetical protein